MDRLRVGAARLGIELGTHQLEQFRIFYEELLDWNQRMNLTAITGYDDVQTKHFLDSLTLTLAWGGRTMSRVRVIDVGTGAGIPGIPVKIVLPGVAMTLLDSTAKKAVFLRHVVQVLGLSDVEIVVGRAEDVAHRPVYREKFDVVLSRGVALLPTLMELTLPFCAIGGMVIAPKKGAIDAEIGEADKAISLLGGELRHVKPVDLDELADNRRLVIVDKVRPTPEKYPRRPGMPAKRPLGRAGAVDKIDQNML